MSQTILDAHVSVLWDVRDLGAHFLPPVKTSSCDKDPGAATDSGSPGAHVKGHSQETPFRGFSPGLVGHSTHLVPTSTPPRPHRGP